MFGYVTIDKRHLTEDEYKTFCAYYCGLCKTIGKRASQLSRLGLSYDITFLALVLSSVSDIGKREAMRCMLHPFSLKDCIKDNPVLSYAASAGVMLSYLKLKDDWEDDRSIKALFAMALFYRGYKKCSQILKREHEIIINQLDELRSLENIGCNSIDDTAGAFGKILEALFTPDFIKDDSMRRTLAWLGFNIGRWIYEIDAVNDFNDDLKSGAYNTFIKMGYTDFDKCAHDAKLGLTLALEGAASAFELIDFKENREIIAKILYIGLKEKQELILKGKGKDRNESIRGSRNKRKFGRGNSKESI